MTRPDVKLSRREYMNLMMWNKRFGAPDFDGGSALPAPAADNKYTGQQVMSALMPHYQHGLEKQAR
jgi:hypothetical protein